MVAGSRGRPPQFLRRVHNQPAIRRRSSLFVFLQLLLVASGLAVGGLAAWGGYHWFHANQVFRLRELDLAGVPPMLRAATREELAPLMGSNILVIDLPAIQQRLERLPQVLQARVRRTLPDTIEVEMAPRPAWGVLRAGRNALAISAEGVVLGQPDGGTELPEVRVAPALRERLPAAMTVVDRGDPLGRRLADAIAIHAWLRANGPLRFGEIAHYRLEPDGVVLVLTDPRWEVAVGDASDLEGKAANLAALLSQAPPAEPSRLDLRYRDMVVVKPLASLIVDSEEE